MSKHRLSPQPDLRRCILPQSIGLQNIPSVTCSGSHCSSRNTQPVQSSGDGNYVTGVEIKACDKPRDMIPPSTLPQSGSTLQEKKATMANVMSCTTKSGCPISSITKGENSQVADDIGLFTGKNAECHQPEAVVQEFNKAYGGDLCNAENDHSVDMVEIGFDASVISTEESASNTLSDTIPSELPESISKPDYELSTVLGDRNSTAEACQIGLSVSVWDGLAHGEFPLCSELRCNDFMANGSSDCPASACYNSPIKEKQLHCSKSLTTRGISEETDESAPGGEQEDCMLPFKLGIIKSEDVALSNSSGDGLDKVVAATKLEANHADVENKEVNLNIKSEIDNSTKDDGTKSSAQSVDIQSSYAKLEKIIASKYKETDAAFLSRDRLSDTIDLEGIVLEEAAESIPTLINDNVTEIKSIALDVDTETPKATAQNKIADESKHSVQNEADKVPKLVGMEEDVEKPKSTSVKSSEELVDWAEPNVLKLPETPTGEPRHSGRGAGNSHSLSSELTPSLPSTSKSSPHETKEKSIALKDKVSQKIKEQVKVQQSSASGEVKGQSSTAKPDGKRRYDRAFLLKLQTRPLCLKKPEGLPRIRIVKNSITRVKPFEPRPCGRAVRNMNNFQDYGPCYIMSSAPRGSSPMYVQHTVYPVSLQNDSIYVPDGPFGHYDYDGPSSHCTTVYYYQPMVDLPPFSPSAQQLPVKQRKLIRIQDPITERDITEEILGAG